MDAVLIAWVQLIQIIFLVILVSQNFGVRARLKAIEEKLGVVRQN